MPKVQKQKVIGFLIFVTLLVALMALSLASIEMKPGEIITLQSSEEASFGANQPPMDVDWFFIFLQGGLIILIILSLVHVLISLFDKEARRKLFKTLIKYGLLMLLIFSLSKLVLPDTLLDSQPLEIQPGIAEIPELTGEVVDPSNFEVATQSWMLLAIICGTAAIAAAITYWVLKLLFKRESDGYDRYSELAVKAQAALKDIESAKIDFDDVIIRCYAEMSQALQTEKGIKRKQAVTPNEFEEELLAKGFPPHPVQQLTQLFVRVRYGHQELGEDAKERATESLREIIAFCRGPA